MKINKKRPGKADLKNVYSELCILHYRGDYYGGVSVVDISLTMELFSSRR